MLFLLNQIFYLSILVSVTLFSCSQPLARNEKIKNILNDEKTFLEYYNSLKLSGNFIALDTSSKIISKKNFFKEIVNGGYLPIADTMNDSIFYKLYKVPDTNANMIYIKSLAEREYNNYQLEGEKLPDFHFVDMKGNVYDSNNTKGKIVILKFWFIGCVPCVEEMPALNEFVKQYQGRKDILFISLAFDKKKDLEKFLSKTPFDYAVIPDKKKYISEELKISSFPTQMIINKDGIVTNVVTDYKDMETELKRMTLTNLK